MNYPDNSTVNPTAKKISFSSATLALIVGLALLLPGAAALAERGAPGLPSPSSQAGIAKAGEAPLPDYLPGKAAPKKAAPTDPSPPPHREVEWQHYYTGTAPPPPPTGGDVLDLPGAPVVTSRSNKKAGIVKAEEPPPRDGIKQRAVQGKNDTEPQKQGSIIPRIKDEVKQVLQKAEEPVREEANSALGQVPTPIGTKPPPKDGGSKAAESPVSFGSGNTGFGGMGPGMAGGGMVPPGAAMGGGGPGPMSPGSGPMGGGHSGPMRP